MTDCVCVCFVENDQAPKRRGGSKLKERLGHRRVNRKRLPSRQYMPVTRYWHWPIMAVGLADGRNLVEKPSGDLRKWGWNWWEAFLFPFLFLSPSFSLLSGTASYPYGAPSRYFSAPEIVAIDWFSVSQCRLTGDTFPQNWSI